MGVDWLIHSIDLIGPDKLPWTLPLYELKKARMHRKLIKHLQTISGVCPSTNHYLTHNGLSEYVGKALCQYINNFYPEQTWSNTFVFMYHESATTMRNRINKIRLINAWYKVSTEGVHTHQNAADLL